VSDKYKDNSDFEINKRVAESRGYSYPNYKIKVNEKNESVIDVFRNDFEYCGYYVGSFDYCNNWSDIGSILTEHGISTRHDETTGRTWAEKNYGSGYTASVPFLHEHANVKRAAAIVFILMMEAKTTRVN